MITERKNWRGLLTDCAGLAFAALWAARGAQAATLPIPLIVAILTIPTVLLVLGFIRRDLEGSKTPPGFETSSVIPFVRF